MLSLLIDLLFFVSAALLFVVLVLLLRGPFRKYPLLLVYVAWEFIAGMGLTVADRLYHGSGWSNPGASNGQNLYAHIYWTNDVMVDLLRFVLVIALTYQAIGESPIRASLGRLLGGVVIAVVLLPFLLFHPRFTPWPQEPWFNSTSEMLNFGAAIMNLVLWGTLIASKQRERQLLTVSAGIGVVVTGAAVAYGLHHFIASKTFRAVPAVFLVLTQIAGWTLWCRAFWPAEKPASEPSGAINLA
jgi:hypothetical protein